MGLFISQMPLPAEHAAIVMTEQANQQAFPELAAANYLLLKIEHTALNFAQSLFGVRAEMVFESSHRMG